MAVLADPLLQKLILLRPSAAANLRIVNWLNAVLQDVMDGDADETTLWDVMSVVRDYVVHTKVSEVNITSPLMLTWSSIYRRRFSTSWLDFCPCRLGFRCIHPFLRF